jgi:hypothetical protein
MVDPESAPAPVRAVAAEVEEYDQGAGQPVTAYAATLATYGTTVAALGFLAWRKRRGKLPDVNPLDVALFGVGTFKMTRVLSKDAVTSPLRAPFTTYRGDADTPVEVMEKARGTGLRRTVGELLTCPFCLGQWVGTGFAFGSVLAPRATRLIAGALASITVSDFLQFAYVATEKRT